MKHGMDEKQHQEQVQRTLALGRSGNAEALGELLVLMTSPSPEIRRLSASAIGKLAAVGSDPNPALKGLESLALQDRHPQVRQYAVKAIKAYGVEAEPYLPKLEDLSNDQGVKEYVRRAASSAVESIREEIRHRDVQKEQRCQRCHCPVAFDEYERSTRIFQRVYCDKCFDETCVRRRNFETRVEEKKHLRTIDGTLVQSDGEKRIAEWLVKNGLEYRYDGRLRIIEGFQIRPDFYLPEFDVYIEYWGMDTPRYKAGMYVKQDLYMQAGKKLISLYPDDKTYLDRRLANKLSAYGWQPTDQVSTSEASQPRNSGG